MDNAVQLRVILLQVFVMPQTARGVSPFLFLSCEHSFLESCTSGNRA